MVLRPEDGAPDGAGDDLGRRRVQQLHPRLLDDVRVVEEVLGAVKVPHTLPLGGQTTYDVHLYLKNSAKRWSPGCVNAAGKARQKR